MFPEFIYLTHCECGVPDEYGDVSPCGKPAVAIVNWGDEKQALYVCQEHLEQIEEDMESE